MYRCSLFSELTSNVDNKHYTEVILVITSKQKRVAILRNAGDREENLGDMEILLGRQDKKYKLRNLDGVIVYNQDSVYVTISLLIV
jgi:hypothetical protein